MMRKVASGFVAIGLALAFPETNAMGQEAAGAKRAEPHAGPEQVQTFYLSSVTQANDAVEIVAGLRNMLDPGVKIFLVQSENALTVRATAEQMALAEKLLKELDRPKKTFRLVYTVTETDSGKKIGVQHFAMVLAPGGRTVLKQGSRVPVATGSMDQKGGPNTTQFTYLDVGLNIDASIDGYADGVRLRTKVEQSSVAEEHLIAGVQEPIIRQTVLEGTSILTQGKPMVLGSADVSGSTRHLEVEVVLEAVL
jgi:type II secretory pathway component GspD/PulD (secretin)